MKPVAIFYHVLLRLGDPPQLLPHAFDIVCEQLEMMQKSGLSDAASAFLVGINDTPEISEYAEFLLPPNARMVFHGLESRSECLTILMLENWVKTHPGWNVFYAHAKGASHDPLTVDGQKRGLWRRGMMEDLVLNWKACVSRLGSHEVVCSHWKWNVADGSQNIAAGNFWWSTSDFLARLPSIMLRDRIKMSGIGSLESRYEAEVWLGNGPKPRVFQFRPHGAGMP